MKLKPKRRASPEMLYVLELASRQGTDIHYVPLVNGKGSQSRTVGRSMTVQALRRCGWLDGNNLTQAGRDELNRRRK